MAKSDETYRLLGVDPGTNLLGFAIVEISSGELKLLELGVVQLQKMDSQQDKLKRIFERIQTVIDIYQPREMAIEAPFYGKNIQSMLKLGRAQGVAIAAAITKGVAVCEYAPRKIKQSVTGNGNASKEQVAAMLEQILTAKLDHYGLDATDALATAVCHHFQSRNAFRKSGKRYDDWSSFLNDNPDRKG